MTLIRILTMEDKTFKKSVRVGVKFRLKQLFKTDFGNRKNLRFVDNIFYFGVTLYCAEQRCSAKKVWERTE